MQYTRRKGEGRDGLGLGALIFTFAVLALLALAVRAPAQQSQEPSVNYNSGAKAKVTGLIVARQGDDMLVRDETTPHALSTVTLTATTTIESPTGFMNLDRKPQNMTSLIPGLIIAVKGSGGARGNLVADKIKFHKSALRVASQISAGEVELKEQQRATATKAQANTDSINAAISRARDSLEAVNTSIETLNASIKKRMSELDSYDTKFSGTVTFATGKAELTTEAKATLDDLVAKGQGLTGYIIEVAGFADATGSAGLNQRLSERRADAVVAYLTAVGSVPLRRIVNPTGLGEARPVATNETPDGRAQNRRVEVKVLVNRGLYPPK